MPKCSRCPIRAECNQNPILVNNPNEQAEVKKLRLCPLLIAVSHALKLPETPKVSTA